MADKFGFIGTGNMGGALAKAVAKSIGGERMLLADYFMDKAKELAAELHAQAADNQTLAAKAQFIYLGVKPQMMAGVLAGIAPVLKARTDRFVLVTMAAGVKMEKISEMAGGNYPIIRIMPNTPAAVGEGMILYTANELVTEDDLAQFTEAMKCAGRLDRLDEKLIDAGCAISGCGPAFMYLMIEALADGGVLCGLPRAKAMEYAAQTMIGAAKMVLETGKHPGELKDMVCSPGGSTIVGVKALEDCGFRSACINAVVEAYEKTKELGN